MTKEEAIENLKLIRLNAAMTGAESFKEALDLAIVSLSQPSLPSSLDEAAEAYRRKVYCGDSEMCQFIREVFKAGAEWMAGQGVTVKKKIGKIDDGVNQIPTYCNGFEITELDVSFLNSKECGYGDEVIVQIRKK